MQLLSFAIGTSSMTEHKKKFQQELKPVGADFIPRFWEESWTYIKTVVDVVHDPVLILDKDLRVTAGNDAFYRTFRVIPGETEKKSLYKLGSGQWDIPILRRHFKDILYKNTFFKGFEVTTEFPRIGRRVMILNARQIHCKESRDSGLSPPIILLSVEDVTDMMVVAETLAGSTNQLEAHFAEEEKKLRTHIQKLEAELVALKKNM